MAENKKAAFLQAKGYSMLSNGTATATALEPGERVLFDEDNPQHVYERKLAESGTPDAAYQFVEVDLKAEAKQEDEQAEMLQKAEEIAAKAREEELAAEQERQDRNAELQEQAQEEGQPSRIEGTDFPPQDEEAQRLAEQSGAGQRATTQEDVVEETKATGRKRSSRS